jgi:hypothetical protein
MTRTSLTELDSATSLLAPAISLLQARVNQTFDIWELFNWIFVSFYWCFLADFGQINPTILYPQTTFPPTNNIFINQSLFEIYSSYLRNTILPLLGPAVTSNFPPLPQFSNLSDENSLKAQVSTFTRTYSCLQIKPKSPLNFIVSVVVAEYALIMGGYKLAILVAEVIQKRKQRDGTSLVYITRKY